MRLPYSIRRDWRHSLRVLAALTATLVVAALVVVALIVLDQDGPGGNDPRGAASGIGSSPTSADAGSATASRSPKPSAPGTSASATTVPPGGAQLLPSPVPGATQLDGGRAESHRVVIVVRSDTDLAVVAYQFRGQARSTQTRNVASPVVIERNVTGPRPYAAVTFQQSPQATRASCRISIDGHVVNARTTDAPFAVTGCVG